MSEDLDKRADDACEPCEFDRRIRTLERSYSALMNATDALFMQTSELTLQHQTMKAELDKLPDLIRESMASAIREVMADEEVRNAFSRAMADGMAAGLGRKVKTEFLDTVWELVSGGAGVAKKAIVALVIVAAIAGPMGWWPSIERWMVNVFKFARSDQ